MKFIYLLAVACLTFSSCNQTKEEKESTLDCVQTNKTVESIMNRRSIRSYQSEQIKAEQLDTIIQCAINAPSAVNKQSWEVRVIQNPELLKTIDEGFIKYAKENNMYNSRIKDGFHVFYEAPTLIIVANDTTNSSSQVDCGLLGQNVLLAAESMDIGTCVIGYLIAYLNSPEGREKIVPQFNLPSGYRPIYTISMGYKNERPDARARNQAKVQFIK
ncbi:NAD(P)H nitroreductase [Bacteroidales bacterium]|nr:NAD(P)H nitroreductase [Bacteroidales bacterium]